jgi:general secretion pathway protein A
MYTQYFGLRERPFALAPDPRYLYMSLRHQEALAHLMYGITDGGGFVQLTGEVGTGKTMLIRAMLERLPENVDVALILYPFLSVREFVAAICDDLRAPYPKPEASLKILIEALNSYLLENHAKGRHTVLIIDEAQKLSHEVLEQVRLLTNLESTKEKLLQILLVGQPELIGLLSQPDLRQLAQRITARYNLKPLSLNETKEYVHHRCRVAGVKRPLFTRPATAWIHRLSGGVPRVVNMISDRALLGAYARSKEKVGPATVRRAAREIGRVLPRQSWRFWAVAAGVIATVSIALAGWRLTPKFLAPPPTNTVIEAPRADAPKLVSPPAMQADRTATEETPITGPALAELLRDPLFATDTETAFTGLYSRWGLDYTRFTGATECDRAPQAGLRCLFMSGTWNNLRQFNRPAVIELVDKSGGRHHVLVASLQDDQVTLEISGRAIPFPLVEVDRFWFGKFLLLWKPPLPEETTLRLGNQGSSVVWLRQVLARYRGHQTSSLPSDVYDAELEEQVKDFQRAHQLLDDGIVGQLTLIQLNAYDPSSAPPTLYRTAKTEQP